MMVDRPCRIALSVLAIVASMLAALLFGPESGTRWVSLLFAGAFATSLPLRGTLPAAVGQTQALNPTKGL
jgi:hypothetical protein